MDMLAEQTGENIFFAVPKDTNVLYIEASTPAASMQSISISGVTAPMYCTGIGKAMLAESGETVIHDAISKPLVSYTQYTIVAPEQLLEELETVRKNGYAIDNMEHEFGVKCVGVPIIKNKKLVGGLSISGPSLRFSDEKIEEYARLLKSTIDNLPDYIFSSF